MARADARRVTVAQGGDERVPIPLAALMITASSAGMWAIIIYGASWLLG